jgi:hypothetical protein
MNFNLKMRFVIFAHFSPSIPPRGVVAISPLFHFMWWEIFAFALVGDIYPSFSCALATDEIGPAMHQPNVVRRPRGAQ